MLKYCTRENSLMFNIYMHLIIYSNYLDDILSQMYNIYIICLYKFKNNINSSLVKKKNIYGTKIFKAVL